MEQLISLSERIEPDYTCPKCGQATVTSGVQYPGGDYDDWVQRPRCLACEFEADSAKNPFDSFLEVPFVPTHVWGMVWTSRDGLHETKCLATREPRGELNTIDFGFGGTIWKGATWKVVAEFDRVEGETLDQFYSRCQF